MRIVECGYYARYLKLWLEFVPPERMLILVFEEDVVKSSQKAVHRVYDFLGLDTDFLPEILYKPVHKTWSWTRIVFHYYVKPFSETFVTSPAANVLDRFDFLRLFAIKRDDIQFLRSAYLPEKNEIETIIGKNLACWNYGEL